MKSVFRLLIKVLPVFLLVLFVSGCAVIPVTDEELAVLGADVHGNMILQYGEYRDGKIRTYVEAVGRRVEASSDYSGEPLTFTVLDTPVVNAFSVPGGYIHVTRGLVARANSESELAFVIGHEIGHLTARHAAQRISQVKTSSLFSSIVAVFVSLYSDDYELGSLVANVLDFSSALVILSYGRDAEFEADSLGLKFEHKAEYNPKYGMKFLSVLEEMEKSKMQRNAVSDLLATHPPSEDRLDRAVVLTERMVTTEADGMALDVKRQEFLEKINGIVIGESLESGLIKDDAYFNKSYGFILRKKEGWALTKARSYLAALHKGRDDIFLVYARKPEGNPQLEEFATSFLREIFEDEKYVPTFRSASFLGLPALDIHTKKGRDIRVRFFRKNGTYYSLIYSYVSKMFVDYDKDFEFLCGRFSFMTPEVASGIKEEKLSVYITEPGDTPESIAKKYYGDSKYGETILKYNGISAGLKAGEALKLAPKEYIQD